MVSELAKVSRAISERSPRPTPRTGRLCLIAKKLSPMRREPLMSGAPSSHVHIYLSRARVIVAGNSPSRIGRVDSDRVGSVARDPHLRRLRRLRTEGDGHARRTGVIL